MTDNESQRGGLKRHFIAALLVFAAWALASLGRIALDWSIQEWPNHEAAIERVGGWLLGLVIVVLVVLPMFRLYGLVRGSRAEDERK